MPTEDDCLGQARLESNCYGQAEYSKKQAQISHSVHSLKLYLDYEAHLSSVYFCNLGLLCSKHMQMFAAQDTQEHRPIAWFQTGNMMCTSTHVLASTSPLQANLECKNAKHKEAHRADSFFEYYTIPKVDKAAKCDANLFVQTGCPWNLNLAMFNAQTLPGGSSFAVLLEELLSMNWHTRGLSENSITGAGFWLLNRQWEEHVCRLLKKKKA